MDYQYNVKQLINDNRWEDIYDKIFSGHIDPATDISNGKNLLTIAALNNRSDIILFAMDTNPALISDSKIPHILAEHGYVKLLKKILRKNKYLINTLDNDGNSIFKILYNDNSFISWSIKNLQNVNFNNVDKDGYTILTRLITLTESENDDEFQTIEMLLEQSDIDLEIPPQLPPIVCCIVNNKQFVAKLLLDYGVDINKKNSYYLLPIHYAIYYQRDDFINFLLDHHSRVDDFGPEGDHNPIYPLILTNKYDLIARILEAGFDVDQFDRNLNGTLHLFLMVKRDIPLHVFNKLLENGDLNKQNMEGNTPLHFLLKNYNWLEHKKLLKKKKLDVFIANRVCIMPIELVSTDDFQIFIDIIVKSYLSQFQHRDNILCINYDKKECKKIIKTHILRSKKSYPSSHDENIINNKFRLIIEKTVNYGQFNADVIHNMIYTIVILNKYNNLGIPYRNIGDKVNNNIAADDVIKNIVNLYDTFFYELTPYLILWKNEKQYYINEHLKKYLNLAMNSKKVKFIFIKLTLISSDISSHANLIIYDKGQQILERFDPYGSVPYLNTSRLDKG